ncbi:hypothetical protein WJX81_004768 [Elliptochloris bilobata]|uniref:Ribosomal protein eL8/eL30/eS12/Gadd45 domain-containing protein n=1 Tax=Elliptochloris bilobata TaxID=381761 RepID=A0AAW1RJZ3_9CHLO
MGYADPSTAATAPQTLLHARSALLREQLAALASGLAGGPALNGAHWATQRPAPPADAAGAPDPGQLASRLGQLALEQQQAPQQLLHLLQQRAGAQTVARPELQEGFGPRSFTCGICNITCWGYPNYERHCASRKHLRKALAAATAADPAEGRTASDAPQRGGPESVPESVHGGREQAGALARQAEPHRPCNQVVTEELNATTAELLQLLVSWQQSAMAADPLGEASAHRRVVFGMREVFKAVRARKAHSVILAPDIKQYEDVGDFDGVLVKLLRRAALGGIPIVYALSRKHIGQALGSQRKMCGTAILSCEGAEALHARMESLAAEGRAAWSAASAGAQGEAPGRPPSGFPAQGTPAAAAAAAAAAASPHRLQQPPTHQSAPAGTFLEACTIGACGHLRLMRKPVRAALELGRTHGHPASGGKEAGRWAWRERALSRAAATLLPRSGSVDLFAPLSSGCSLGDAPDMVLLANFLGVGAEDFAPPQSVFAASAAPQQLPQGGKHVLPWAGVNGALAESTLPRDCVLEILGLQPEPGAENSPSDVHVPRRKRSHGYRPGVTFKATPPTRDTRVDVLSEAEPLEGLAKSGSQACLLALREG